MHLRHTFLLGIVLIINSCSTTISNFDKYKSASLDKSKFMPTREAVDGIAPKVIIFELSNNNIKYAQDINLGSYITNNIEKLLTSEKLINLVDRNASGKLKNEIVLSEMKSTGSYKGPVIADYAIMGNISTATFTSKKENGSVMMTRKGGFAVTSPQYRYTATVGGIVKIYQIPSLDVIKTITFESNSAKTEDSSGIAFISFDKPRDVDNELLREAALNAIESARIDLESSFAKKGYIMEKRIYKKNVIFKVSLGNKDGITQDNNVVIQTKEEEKNDLTGENMTNIVKLAEGKVSDQITTNYCWIVINDKKDIDKIKIGNSVTVLYKKTFKDSVSNFTKNVNNFAK